MIVVYLDSFQTCQFFSSWNLQLQILHSVEFHRWMNPLMSCEGWDMMISSHFSGMNFFFILPPIIMEVKYGSQPMASLPFIWGSLENFHDCGRKGDFFFTFFL